MQDGKGGALVVEVIPIVKGLTKPSLSYFTTRKISPGELVKVPVRNGQATAIVDKVYNASRAKSDLKRQNFSLKKVSGFKSANSKKPPARVPEAFMTAARRAAAYYATSVGAILGTVLPKMFLEEPSLIFENDSRSARRNPGDPRLEPLLIQMDQEERLSQYKSIVRESLAKKTSVMFVSPTEEEASRAFEYLSYGIEEYAYYFSLSRKPRELKKVLKDAKGAKRPVLFVTTPAGIAFDRSDLETVIIERENSAAYRTLSRPYIHFGVFLKYLAAESKKRLILGDSVLSLETLWREKNGDYREFLPLKWRLSNRGESVLIDMKSESRPLTLGEGGFEIISPELKDLILEAKNERSRVLLFGARKGLSPTTVCGDCGSVLSCKNCGAPVVLHSETAANIYICHVCRARRSPETRCDICGSWKLSALGIGIDRIAEEVSKILPKVPIYILDKDHAPTASQARRIVRDFREHGGVLVGTELALLFIDKIPYSGVVSLDSLFSIPDFNINERIFYIVSRLREITERKAVIQTRNIGKKIIGWAAVGNILEFYKNEIAEREELFYPPESIFLKITVPQAVPDSTEKLEYLKQTFGKWRPEFVESRAGQTMILRVERDRWPIEDLSTKLSLLSPEFLIKVDPESIL